MASIAGAIHTRFPDIDLNVDIETSLTESQSIPFAIRQTINAWINTLHEKLSSPFILVMDDLHEIHELSKDGREFKIEEALPIAQKHKLEVTGPPIEEAGGFS